MSQLVVVCGMPAEKSVLEFALPGVTILSGTAKNNLADLVPGNTTHIISMGLYGGLIPSISVADVDVASSLTDGAGNDWIPDSAWTARLIDVIGSATIPGSGVVVESPQWAARAHAVPWYSSGQLDQADTKLQRAQILAETGAWAIDDESHNIAQFAEANSIKFAIMRACSDDASETLPLAMRGQIMNADGSANIEYFLQQIAQEPIGQTLDIPKIVADYNSSLAALQAAAPLLLSSLD